MRGCHSAHQNIKIYEYLFPKKQQFKYESQYDIKAGTFIYIP